MKAKHLLAALVLPAVFTACSQEELTTNVEKEVVGTPIGYLEFTASKGHPATRLSEAGWEAGDKIGLGWISADELTATANLFSNHPLYYKSDKGNFKSETMVYEGLYIASFPFQKTQTIAPLEFDLSKQKSEDSYLAGRWYVSDKFFTLDDKSAGLGNATKLNLVPLTNLMKLNIKLGKDAKVPEDFKVTGVTLDDGSNGKLVNKLKFVSNNSAVLDKASSLAVAVWDVTAGNIDVQVGEDKVGSAIDVKDGLNVYVQMGAFDDADATTLVIHTNYGDANITIGSEVVSWSSKDLGQDEATKVATFADAIQAMQGKATGKEYGQNVAVNVTLDEASIEVNNVVTNQAELEAFVSALKTLGKLKDNATIQFGLSGLKTKDNVVESEGDVVITDISVVNAIKGKITFAKDPAGPTNIYIAGELAPQGEVASSTDLKILNGQTLTVAKDFNLGENNLTVNAGATLVNKAKISVSGADKAITTAAKVAKTDKVPAIPAGLYISEEGASVDLTSPATFTNEGAVEWKGGALPTTMDGELYANVATAIDMVNAGKAFKLVTGNSTNEVIIANDMSIATQLTETKIDGVKKMTIKGNVTFGLGMENAFTFSELETINVESGSFNLTGGNAGKGENDFYAFATAAGCEVNLASGTELSVAAGTKLDLSASGAVYYTGATVTNYGYIVGNSASGSGTWTGNAINVNPKAK